MNYDIIEKAADKIMAKYDEMKHSQYKRGIGPTAEGFSRKEMVNEWLLRAPQPAVFAGPSRPCWQDVPRLGDWCEQLSD